MIELPAPALPSPAAATTIVVRDAGPSDSPRHFEFVDSLRGFAILGVMMLHSSLSAAPLPNGLQSIAKQGEYGVQLFFIVSAFTIFWSLQSRITVEAKPLHAFYTRRFFRIAPLFWIGAIFYTAVHWAASATFGPTHFGPPEFIATLLFVHGWHPASINTVVPGGWSIGAEFTFYLCIPLLFRCVRSLNVAATLALAATIAVGVLTPFAVRSAVAQFAAYSPKFLEKAVFWSFPAQFPVFCMGFVLYFLLRDQLSRKLGAQSAGSLSSKPVFLLLFLATIATSVFCKVHQVTWAAFFVAFAYGLSIVPTRILVNRVTQFIGLVSFSAYIWHFWLLDRVAIPIVNHLHIHVLKRIDGTVHFLLVFAALFAVTIPASAVSHYLIEAPGQNLGKLLIKKMEWGRRR